MTVRRIDMLDWDPSQREFFTVGISRFKEHELREIVAEFCKLPGIMPSMNEQFENIIKALNYQGGVNGDENSLTVGEIRRAL